MQELIFALDRWQTLIGGVLGGVIIALTAALIVAGSATRRAQRIAATLLTSNLLAIHATAQNLKNLATEAGISSEDYPLWVSEKLLWRRLRLSVLFESQMARLMDVDVTLAAHLSFVKTIYTTVEEHIARIAQDAENLRIRVRRVVPRSSQATAADADAIANGLALAGEHAACAHHLISQLVLSPIPRYMKRVRMWLHPSEQEKRSRKLIDEGRI